ncbi:MAG: septum formation initiator family protein [Treponema sp.]|jgi:cell division protein FtsB|nr:septum formation initiator family protein [Treponema sp.]
MSIFKYLLGFWTAIAVYTLFSFFAGPKGLSAYNYLLFEKEQQLGNIRELTLINEDLDKTRNNLLYDQDTLLVHARQMGFGYENEHFIRIVGLSNAKPVPAEVGVVYTAQAPSFISERYIKITALSLGLMLFVFLFMMEFIDKRSGAA